MDLRYLGGGRPTMRDPKHPAWPRAGERTELRDVAERWKWAYVDLHQQQHRQRVIGVSRPMLLKDAAKEYLAHRLETVARSTRENDRAALTHLTDDFANQVAYSVEPQRTLNRLLREGYRPYTVEIYSVAIGAFWKWMGLPYTVELPSYQKSDARVWTDDEVSTLREKAGDLLTAIDCGLYMGLRYGEIYGLRWSDVDLPSWTVRVIRQQGGGPLKSRKARTALILPGWTHPAGAGPVVGKARRQRLTTVLKRAGLLGFGVGWHSFRHTYARMFLERKPDMRLLQASLGHASVTTTEAAYDHLLPDRAAAIARKAIHGI